MSFLIRLLSERSFSMSDINRPLLSFFVKPLELLPLGSPKNYPTTLDLPGDPYYHRGQEGFKASLGMA